MNDFDRLCKEVESLNPLEYGAIITAKTVKILPALRALSEDPADTIELLATFIIASVYADGKLDEAEYLLLLPMMKLFLGETYDYDSAKKIVKAFKPEGRELKKVVDCLVDILGEFSEDLKDDVITVCLLICAIDGKISHREKRYIKQLIR